MLEQDSEWYDQVNASEFAPKIGSQTALIKAGLGEKLGQTYYFLGLMCSGWAISIIRGWSYVSYLVVFVPLMGFVLTIFGSFRR
jgi:ATP-binding cassette subfamily B (MDR/TAP) protein 1